MSKPNVAIEPLVHERLRAYVDVKGLKMRALVTRIISQYLDRVKAPK